MTPPNRNASDSRVASSASAGTSKATGNPKTRS
jgi:hypothetical protein